MKPLTIILGALGIGALGYYAYKNYQPGQKAAASFGPLPELPPSPAAAPTPANQVLTPVVQQNPIATDIAIIKPQPIVPPAVIAEIIKPAPAPVIVIDYGITVDYGVKAPEPQPAPVPVVQQTVTPTVQPEPIAAPVYTAPIVYSPRLTQTLVPAYDETDIKAVISSPKVYLDGCLV